MPITIQVFVPAGETTATLTAITGTGTAANPYTITQQGTSQFGTITVADAANLLGLWQVKVGTRAIHRVEIVAGTTNYPLLSTQAAAAAAITAAGLATAGDVTASQAAITNILGTPTGASIAADIAAMEADAENIKSRLPAALVDGRIDSNVSRWRGTQPGNVDSNGFVPGNLAAINGSTTRASTLASALDNNLLNKLSVSGTLAHTDNAATFRATGFATPQNVTDAKAEIITALGSVEATVGQDTIDEIRDGLATTSRLNEVETSILEAVGEESGFFKVNLTIRLSNNTTVPDAEVTLTSTSSSPSVDVVASGWSKSAGEISFDLDPGVYYIWRRKNGVNFTNPKTLTVASDGTATIT